jgi:hypothetical protein
MASFGSARYISAMNLVNAAAGGSTSVPHCTNTFVTVPTTLTKAPASWPPREGNLLLGASSEPELVPYSLAAISARYFCALGLSGLELWWKLRGRLVAAAPRALLIRKNGDPPAPATRRPWLIRIQMHESVAENENAGILIFQGTQGYYQIFASLHSLVQYTSFRH